MRIGTVRSIVGSLSRTLKSGTSMKPSLTCYQSSKLGDGFSISWSFPPQAGWVHRHQFSRHFSIFSESTHFDSLTDSRFPKRRPLDKPRRKRSSIKPPGPYAWVKHVTGEPVQASNPNKGSVKRRNERKRIKLRHAFIKAEAKKRKAQLQEAKKKKLIRRVERKMAAVARDRAWAQRLAELQQLEEEKKKSTA